MKSPPSLVTASMLRNPDYFGGKVPQSVVLDMSHNAASKPGPSTTDSSEKN